MSLSPEIVTVLAIFQSAFTYPTWEKAQVLIIGTLLAHGRRTVTAALRQMGRGAETDFSRYHQVLNRAQWSALKLSHLLLLALIKAFVAASGSLTFVIDETLERRWGPRISKRGHCRDALLSSRKKSVSSSSLALGRPVVGGQPAVDYALRSLAGAERAGPCTKGQPTTQASPQDHRPLGAANDYAGAALAARRPPHAARRWLLQRG